MARKEKENGQLRPDGAGGNGQQRGLPPMPIFVEGFLNDTDKEWLEANRHDISTHILNVLELVEEGYILSVKYEERSTRFMASLTMREKNHPNSGMCLVSRAASSIAATYALSYRHFYKFAEQWRDAGAGTTGEWD